MIYMTIDRQIEFYEREYRHAKSREMALVAFGAYMALMQLRSDQAASHKVKP